MYLFQDPRSLVKILRPLVDDEVQSLDPACKESYFKLIARASLHEPQSALILGSNEVTQNLANRRHFTKLELTLEQSRYSTLYSRDCQRPLEAYTDS